jgi:hypothetical protein
MIASIFFIACLQLSCQWREIDRRPLMTSLRAVRFVERQ